MSMVIDTDLLADATYVAGRNYPIVGYKNIVDELTVSSTTAAAGYPATNLGNPSTNLLWQGAGLSDEYVYVTNAGAVQLDYMAIVRHNLAGATVSVEYESAPSTYSALVQTFVPTDNSPIIIRFVKSAYTKVRLKISGQSVAPYIAVMYVGEILLLERKVYVGHQPAPLARTSSIVNAVSESGNFLGRILLSKMTSTAVALTNLTPAWVRSYLDPFLKAAAEEPFFFAWCPYDYPNEVTFGWITDNPKPSNASPNGMMSVTFNMTGVQE